LSGKKRGAAVVIREEEGRGRRHQGRRGARPSSLGKKRGVTVVVREEEGRWLRGEERRRLSSSGKKGSGLRS
jgi:hypothetical protein